MPDRPLLSLTLIAKNEKANVKRLLDSLWPWVDEVCVADTGSKDGTLAEFKRYAARKKEPGKLKTTTFTDCNDEDGKIADFASARQAADDLATGEWVMWADMDDTVTGGEQLRAMAQNAAHDVVAFFTQYSYAQDPDRNTISELWRERVVRNDGTRWQGRLHEHKLFTHGQVVKVSPEISEWIHHRDHTQRTGERNLRILEQWDKDEPNNPRIVHSLAMEYMGDGRLQDAADTFARFLSLPGEPPDRRAQATRHMCVMLLQLGRPDQAKAAALQSFSETPLWADTHLTLAEAAQMLGRPAEGLLHAQTAMQIGKPDTLLIINPLQYTAQPRALMAVCLAQMGRTEEAVAMVDECLRIAPSYALAAQYGPIMKGQLKRQHATEAVLALVEVLVEAGELQKARLMLDQAPFYITDEQAIVRRRGQLHRLIAERTGEPAALPEDEQADAFVKRHLEEAA